MGRWSALGRFAGSLVETSWRRLLGKGRSQHWTFKYEVVHGYLERTADLIVEQPTEKLRARHEAMAERRGFELPVDREPDEIAGVSVEWFRPAEGEVADEALLVYVHGGAYLFGSTRTHANLIGRLVLDAGIPALGINYRLAPEHTVEEAREDVISVWEALLERGWSPDAMAMAGDSAGGGLAVLAAIELAARGRPEPAALGLISPWVDLTCSSPSYFENEPSDYGTAEHIRKWRDRVVSERPADDPVLSPIYADLEGLPPTLVHYGGGELLADDCIRFVDALREAGVEVESKSWPEMVHAFHAFFEMLPAGREAVDELADYLAERVRNGDSDSGH